MRHQVRAMVKIKLSCLYFKKIKNINARFMAGNV
jgi:hypothetical protein